MVVMLIFLLFKVVIMGWGVGGVGVVLCFRNVFLWVGSNDFRYVVVVEIVRDEGCFELRSYIGGLVFGCSGVCCELC